MEVKDSHLCLIIHFIQISWKGREKRRKRTKRIRSEMKMLSPISVIIM
jgi:hypothetical protein